MIKKSARVVPSFEMTASSRTMYVRSMLRKAIEESFPQHPLPDNQPRLEGVVMAEHLTQLLLGRSWIEPTPEEYFSCEDGLLLLDDHLLHYYFPGYLHASLAENNESLFDRVLEFLTASSWEYENCKSAKLVEELNESQALVLMGWGALDVFYGSDRMEALVRKLESKRWQGSNHT